MKFEVLNAVRYLADQNALQAEKASERESTNAAETDARKSEVDRK